MMVMLLILHDGNITNLDPKKIFKCAHQTIQCSRPHTLDFSHEDVFHIRTVALTVEPTEMLIAT